jgi:hypothetical protein
MGRGNNLERCTVNHSQPGSKGATLRTEAPASESRKLTMAKIASGPWAGNASLIGDYSRWLLGEVDLSATVAALKEIAGRTSKGDLSDAENLLSAQAATLNAIFGECARRAHVNMSEHIDASERYLRLALKAQAQCRATLETISAIKNPPMVIAKQANIAAGHQQINNLPSAAQTVRCSETPEITQNKLLERPNDDGMDTGALLPPIRKNPSMAAMGSFDRTSNG